ncbi:metal-sulfur cluster biosynthetic enzyme, partial [Thermococci archaeon]
IKDQLIKSVKDPLEKMNLNVEVKTVVMNREELQNFLKKEEENWRGM